MDADFPPCANYQRPAFFFTVGWAPLLCAAGGLRRLGRPPHTHPAARGTSRVLVAVNNRVPSWQSRGDVSRRRDKVISSTFCFLIVSVLLTDRCRTYHLEVIQQPEVSAEFGSAVLSRLPLAPPLVAQLIIRDSRGNVIES